MSTYDVDPGARVLWCLRRRATDVRCVLYAELRPVEVYILQDRDVVLKETFADDAGALNWSNEYCRRLRAQGWRDSPAERSPSSAA